MVAQDDPRKPKGSHRTANRSREQLRALVGEVQMRPALMPQQPSERNRALGPCAQVIAVTPPSEKGAVSCNVTKEGRLSWRPLS